MTPREEPDEFTQFCVCIAKQMENVVKGPGGIREVVCIGVAHFRVAMLMAAMCMKEESFTEFFSEVIVCLNKDIDELQKVKKETAK